MTSKRTSRRLKGQDEIVYINHLSSKALGRDPTTFGEFLQDIGPDNLNKYPILDQIGGTCSIFSVATAISIAKGRMEPTPTQCARGGDGSRPGEFSAKQKSKGAGIEDILKQYDGLTYKNHNRSNQNMKLSYQSNSNKLAEHLRTCVLVVGCQSLGTPTTTSVKYKKGNRLVPGFWGGIGGYEDHAICIIGCYKDETLGPCFVTKTTNHVWESGKTLSFKPKKGKRKVRVKRDCISFAVYPVKMVDRMRAEAGYGSAVDEVFGIPPQQDMEDQMERLSLNSVYNINGQPQLKF